MLYFFVISFTFCTSLLWLVRRTEARGLGRNQALDLSLAIMIAGFIGARLMHVFFEEPAYYAEDPWRVLEVWRGGFVWYGGAIAGGGAGVILARFRKLELPVWLDLFAPILAFGYAAGRIACWLVGCCYGSFCHLIEGMTFRYPTQAFAVFWETGVLALLLHIEKQRREARASGWLQKPGRLFSIWLVLHSCGRIIMEWFRADPRGPEPLGLSLATWISLALVLSVVAIESKRSSR